MQVNRTTNESAVSRIYDWYTLGAAIGVKTNVMSYVLKSRDSMQKRIKLGERTVYKSEPLLRHVQSRLITLVEPLFDALPETESVLAYRKGITATEVVRKVPHAKTFISFDIRHYYDSVTLDHIAACLCKLGMGEAGAKLVARYCIVKNKKKSTLQQGSPVSPVLSNIVGHFYFDKPIKEWLRNNYPTLQVTYLRYCDNIALFVHDDMPEGFSDALKAYVKETLKADGFLTHKWATVADNHPVMHQKFLGMVINAEARAELDTVDRLRAILFNWCRTGLWNETKKFMSAYMEKDSHHFKKEQLLMQKFKQHLRGHVQYIKRLSRKQGMMLEKLYHAAEFLDTHLSMVRTSAAVFAAVKSYRNHEESVQKYLNRLQALETSA